MKTTDIFELNKLADHYETIAKHYRIVANDLMKLQPKGSTPKKTVRKNRKGVVKGFKYNGTHWKQKLAAQKKVKDGR